jgi:hypothetical protein
LVPASSYLKSIIATLQIARASIPHAGAIEARAVLDDLEQRAKKVVANARLEFDRLMRANLQ